MKRLVRGRVERGAGWCRRRSSWACVRFISMSRSFLSCRRAPRSRRAPSRRHVVRERNPVPLAVFEPGCSFRKWAVESLDSIGRPHRIAYSSESVAGLVTTVEAGLAVTVLPRSGMPADFRELTPDEGFPVLPVVDIGLIPPRDDAGPAVHTLANHIAQVAPG